MRSPRALGAFFVLAGAMHFLRRREYEAIVPEYVPISAEAAVRWSGAAEIAGGIAAAAPPTRRLARWWLLSLLAAVFPANVQMALEPKRVLDRGAPIRGVPRSLLWARLPVQALFAAWVLRATEAPAVRCG